MYCSITITQLVLVDITKQKTFSAKCIDLRDFHTSHYRNEAITDYNYGTHCRGTKAAGNVFGDVTAVLPVHM